MSYFAQLANKSINQTNLYGFEKYFTIFRDLYEKNLFPNQILISGISGIGKATFAYHFINFVLSHNEKNNYNFSEFRICDSNRSFNLIQKNSHPNFFLIDLIDDQQSIDINQVRNMINYSNKTTFGQNKKFILIDNVENLNNFSANALLKIIEHPNDNTFYILIHDSSKPIAKTLKSRCVDFKILFSYKEKKKITKKLFEQSSILEHFELIDGLSSYYDSPGFLLWQVSHLWQKQINRILKPFGLTQPQFVIIARIYWHKLRALHVNQVQIASFSCSDPVVVSNVIKRLESKGLIIRTEAKDMRAKLLDLSEKCLEIIPKAIRAVETEDEVFFSHIKGVDDLKKTLNTLVDNNSDSK